MRVRQDADLKKAGDERVRAAMAESQRLEVETAKVHEEAKRKAEQAKSGALTWSIFYFRNITLLRFCCILLAHHH